MKKWLPIFVSVLIITMNVLSADAAENILRGVNVRASENAYTIELTSTAPARMTKNIVSANRVIINLKDVSISDNLSTKFDGNAVIDNVMVEPCGMGDVNVMVQGDNIAYSNVEFKEPTAVEQMQDSVSSSFTSLLAMFSGSNASNRAVQFGTLLIFGIILIGEVRFIKSKYDELKAEKQQMVNDIQKTSDFKEFMPGYGNVGLKKPYTTPIYGTARNTANIRANYLKHLRTPETATLNMLMHNNNQESKILDRIVNNKPVFGSLSNINIDDNVPLNTEKNINNMISNPLPKSRLKSNLKHLESMTALYKNETNVEEADREFYSRLNRLY